MRLAVLLVTGQALLYALIGWLILHPPGLDMFRGTTQDPLPGAAGSGRQPVDEPPTTEPARDPRRTAEQSYTSGGSSGSVGADADADDSGPADPGAPGPAPTPGTTPTTGPGDTGSAGGGAGDETGDPTATPTVPPMGGYGIPPATLPDQRPASPTGTTPAPGGINLPGVSINVGGLVSLGESCDTEGALGRTLLNVVLRCEPDQRDRLRWRAL